jgi:hypothetical protein
MLASSTGRACFRLLPDSLVLTRGTPPRVEGCRPASRGLALALMTWAQFRKRAVTVNSIVTNMVFSPRDLPGTGAAGSHKC